MISVILNLNKVRIYTGRSINCLLVSYNVSWGILVFVYFNYPVLIRRRSAFRRASDILGISDLPVRRPFGSQQ